LAGNEKQTELDQQRFDTLSSRETQVFEFLVQGLAGKQIAVVLGIRYRTVEKFRGKVMQNLPAKSSCDRCESADGMLQFQHYETPIH
jgi:FixJ family two-component response regulator